MHDCPECGASCGCDMEDHEQPYDAEFDCTHDCQEEDDDNGSIDDIDYFGE